MSFKKSADVIIVLDNSPSTEEPRRQTTEHSETSEKPLKITEKPSTTTEESPNTTAESQKTTQEPPKTTEDAPKTAKESPKEILIPRKHGCLESLMSRTIKLVTGRNYLHHEDSNTSVNVDEDFLVDILFSSSWAETKCLDLRKQIERVFRENVDAFESNDRWLCDIEFGKILAARIPVDCQSFDPKGKDLTFLWSTFVKRDDLFEPLYEMNANIHSTVPKLGYNALHLAAFRGHVKACEWLISKGLDRHLTVDGVSPLHCAILRNSLDCTKLLLSQGAVLDSTVLDFAFQANAKELLPYLLNEYVKRNIVDENDLTASHSAADRSIEKCVQIMISYFPEADLKTTTPLHLAAGNNLPECCQFLINGGAHPDAVDHKGRTPLHFAAKAKSVECLKKLLKAGCKVNAKAKDGRTPLHMLFPTNVPALNALEVLLKAGADVNMSDNLGFTPLHVAAETDRGVNACPQCVNRLIMNGSNISARTDAGLSALSIISKSCPDSIDTIRRKLDSLVNLVSLSELSKERGILHFNFSYFTRNSSSGFILFLKTLQSEGQEKLLEHPVCQAYLHLLWQNIRKFYFGRLFLWFIFVIILTAYVIYAVAHECIKAASSPQACRLNNFTIFNATEEKPDVCKMCLNNSIIGPFLIERPHVIMYILYVLVLMAILESTWKIWIMLGTRSKKHYFFQLDNIFEWFVILSVFLLCDFLPIKIGEPPKTIGGIAVLLGWADLMIMIGQLPIYGTYVTMLTGVQNEFFKLLLFCSCLLIGITSTLCVLLPSDDSFQNPLNGFLEILAMMTGEFNLEIVDKIQDSKPSAGLKYGVYLIYAFSLIFVTVILMTQLTGMAVPGNRSLRRTANVSKLIQQVKLIYSVERAINKSYLPKKVVNFICELWRRVIDNPIYCAYSPHEDRLPKEVLMAALNVCVQKEKWIGTTCCWLNTLKDNARSIPNEDEKNAHEELRQLKDTVSQLVRNNSNNLFEEIFIKHERNTQEEILQLKKMVQAQNEMISKFERNDWNNS